MGFYSLLQGIFLTQGLNSGLLLYRWILYHLSQQGSPKYEEGYKEHSSVSFFFVDRESLLLVNSN